MFTVLNNDFETYECALILLGKMMKIYFCCVKIESGNDFTFDGKGHHYPGSVTARNPGSTKKPTASNKTLKDTSNLFEIRDYNIA